MRHRISIETAFSISGCNTKLAMASKYYELYQESMRMQRRWQQWLGRHKIFSFR
jgi:hypothetical protein